MKTLQSTVYLALVSALWLATQLPVFGLSGDLQGLDKASATNGWNQNSAWVAGNLQDWKELDFIPCRVSISGDPRSNQLVSVIFPHFLNGTPGFQNLYFLSNSPNLFFNEAPVLNAAAASNDWSYSMRVTITNAETGYIYFYARLAAGAHLNEGSSLHLNGEPSLSPLQIHKPGPGPGSPDLAVGKSGPTSAIPAGVITYSLTYTNKASGTNNAAHGVQISDVLPSLIEYVAGSASGGGTLVGNTLTWDLPDLGNGANGAVTYQARVLASATEAQVFTNCALILSSEDDANISDNRFSVATTVRTNRPPVANPDTYTATEDTPLNVSAPGVLGNDTDLEGGALTAVLVNGPTNGTLTLNTNGSFSYTPNLNYNGTDAFTYQANDGDLDSSPVAVTITISPINDAPVLAAIPDQNIVEGIPWSLTASATDVDLPANTLSYSLSNAPAGMVIGSASGVISWTPTEAQGPGTNLVTVIVTDDGSPIMSASQSFTVVVQEANTAPVLATIPDQSIVEGVLWSLTASATDVDLPANTLAYSLSNAPAGMVIGSASGVISWTPAEDQGPATNLVTVIVTDDGSPIMSAAQSFTVVVQEANIAPVLAGIPDQSIPEEALWSLSVVATDTDIPANTLTYSLSNAPAGMVIGPASGVISWTPTEAQGPSTNLITVIVTDNGTPSLAAQTVLTVTVQEINAAPVAYGQSLTNLEDTPLTIELSGSDPEGSPLVYTILVGPTNGTLSTNLPAANQFTYLPFTNYHGLDGFTFSVSDGELAATNTVILTILPVNDPPMAFSQTLTAVERTPLPITLGGMDLDNDPLTYWIMAYPSNGVLSGTAPQLVYNSDAGRFGRDTFLFAVSDGSVTSATAVVQIDVTPVPRSRTYTTAADFEQGHFYSVETGGKDEITLRSRIEAFNNLWVAVSTKGTIVRIDAETGQIKGEYWSSPNGQGKDPSRTTVDQDGNVWAANRGGNGVVHISVPESGLWVDRNGNGVLDTSTGLGDVRPWPNTGGVDSDGGTDTAADELILHYVKVRSSNVRHVSVNADNNVWVSGTGGRYWDLIDGATGQIIRQEPSVNYGGYGGIIDRTGVIWSSNPLLRWDTSKPLTGTNGGNWRGYSEPSYGIGVDSQRNVWVSTMVGTCRVLKFDTNGNLVGSFFHGAPYAQGVVVDLKDDVWVAHSLGGCTVGHLKNDGRWIGNIKVGSGPTGVAVDHNGKIWVTLYGGGNVVRIDPNRGPLGSDGETPVGEVDFTGPYLGGALYNYSDMTGSTLAEPLRQGNWYIVFDGEIPNAQWGPVAYNCVIFDDGQLEVAVATSEDNQNFGPYEVLAQPNQSPAGRGRYLRIAVSFRRSSNDRAPILKDITVGTVGYDAPVVQPWVGVYAGEDREVHLPLPAVFQAAVCHNDFGFSTNATFTWSKVSGPGTVEFENTTAAKTRAWFSAEGTYVVRVEANLSNTNATDEVQIHAIPINRPPWVYVGMDRALRFTNEVLHLEAMARDDGLPYGSTLSVNWRKLAGPGEVSFSQANSTNTDVQFTTPGIYTLELAATDGQLTNTDHLEVRVEAVCHIGVPRGIAHWWPGNADAYDWVRGNNLSLCQGASYAPGKISHGFYFNGTNNYARASAHPNLDIGAEGTFSIEFWIKPATSGRLLEWNENGVQGVYVDYDAYWNWITFNLVDTAGQSHATNYSSVLSKSEFRHVTFTYNKNTGQAILYTNGTVVSIHSFPAFTPRTRGDFFLAGYTNAASRFGGVIDELALYNQALHPNEIAEIWSSQPAGKPPMDNNTPPAVALASTAYVQDRSVALPLAGVVTDDGLPEGIALYTQWRALNGPGQVTFADPANPATTATFSLPGIYVLELYADDAVRSSRKAVEVRVETTCTIKDPAGLVAWWPGNMTAADMLSSNVAGLMNGTTFTNGMVSGAFQLDGTNDYVLVPSRPELNVGQSAAGFTLEFWARAGSSGVSRGVLGWHANTDRGVKLHQSGSSLTVRLWDTNNGTYDMTSVPVFDGTWKHLALTYDRVTGVGRIYSNGVMLVNQNLGVFVPDTRGAYFTMGYWPTLSYFAGQLDEVSLYNRPLNPEEINGIYTAGAVGKCPADANQPPVVYAGPDRLATNTTEVVPLAGLVEDDGLPAGRLRIQWRKYQGPGQVSFGDTNAAQTTAQFDTPGIYLLELVADDTAIQGRDLVEVRVGTVCTVKDPASLVAWWPANGTAVDVVSGQAGALVSGATYTTGMVSWAFQLDGTNDYVLVPSRPELNVGQSAAGFTLEFWARATNGGSLDRGVIGWHTNGSLGGVKLSQRDATLAMRMYDTNGGIHDVTSVPVFDGTWKHLALTYDRVTGVGRFYSNGVMLVNQNLGVFVPDTRGWYFTMGYWPTLSYFAGQLDEVSLYNRPLNPEEINGIYTAGAVGKCPADANQPPVVYAGPDRLATNTTEVVPLAGLVEDDGLPAGRLRIQWRKYQGPGQVSFGDTNAAQTTAQFDTPGIYLLELVADDTAIQGRDLVEVRVGTVCTVKDPASLVAWWPANGTAVDVVSGQAGALVSGATYTTGMVSGAFQLDGTNDYVLVPSRPELNVGQSAAGFTLEFWTRATSSSPDRGVIGWHSNANYGGVKLSQRDATLSMRMYDTNGGIHDVTSVQVFDGTWKHLALTYDRVTGQSRLYTNGVPVVTNTLGVFVPDTRGQYFTIGYWPTYNTFAGQLDEVSIYNRPLPLAEIQAIYQAGAAGKCITPTNQPPVVLAGADETLYFPPNTFTLHGAAYDDGLPAGSTLALAWTYLEGPGPVGFSSTNEVVTTVTVPGTGTYRFELAADDGQFRVTDTVTVTVVPDPRTPPTVALTSPAEGFIQVPAGGGTNLTLTASASDADGWVTDVEFFQNGASLAVLTREPYTLTLTNLPAGNYTFTVVATDYDLLTATSAPVHVTIYTDTGWPTVAIFSPEDGATLTAPTVVTGTVATTILQSWALQYRLKPADSEPQDPTSWTTAVSGTTVVSSNALGTFDPTLLLNGIYELRLSATDLVGRTTVSEPITVVVDRNLKVGHFTISFKDLAVPVAGLPLQITRTYDSRAASAGVMGDFGIGWTLDIKNVRLQKNRPLGRNWVETSTGGLFPTYALDPISPRIVTITFPDNRVEKFLFDPVPSMQSLFPIDYPQWNFTKIGNTRGSLVPALIDEEDGEFLIVVGGIPGTVNLYDLNFFSEHTFAPPEELDRYPTLFRYTSPEQFKYLIDEREGLKSVTDPNGNTLVISTNGMTWTNATGQGSSLSLAFQRDSQGRITNIVDGMGHRLAYSYDTNGDLVNFVDRDNNVNSFGYGSRHYLLTLTDSRGIQVLENQYDGEGRLVRNADALGNATTYGHDLENRREFVTNRLGYVTINEYDALGNIIRVTDPAGAISTYLYDQNNNLLVKSNANGCGCSISYTYDEDDNRISETDAKGNTTTYTYNSFRKILTMREPSGFTTTNTYDELGNLLSTRDGAGQEATFTYNRMGKVTSLTDPRGYVTQFEYNDLGILTNEVNALGHATYYTVDGNGNILSQETATTRISGLASAEKHKHGWLLASDQVIVPEGPVTNTYKIVMRYEYTPSGFPLRTLYYDGTSTSTSYTNGKPLVTTDNLGRQTSCEYNPAGQLARKVYPNGCEETFEYDAEGQLIRSVDKRGYDTEYEYDQRGKLVRTEFADGSEIRASYYYDGSLYTETSKTGEVTTYGLDEDGNRTSVRDASGTTIYTYNYMRLATSKTDPLQRTSHFEYDALARNTRILYPDDTEKTATFSGRLLTSQTDQNGRTTQYDYDALGQLIAVTDALGNVTSYSYDPQGNKISETDPLDRTTYYEYDLMRRRVRTIYPDGSSAGTTYDAAGRVLVQTDQVGETTSYAYDDADNVLSITDALGHVTRYTYDCGGNKLSQVDPNGTTNTFTYDALSRLTRTTYPDGTSSVNTYDVPGRLTAQTDQSGKVTSFTYDNQNRLLSVTDSLGQSNTFTYDAVGNRLTETDANGQTKTHEYDGQDRKKRTSYSDGTTEEFGYDGVGRLIRLKDQTGKTSLFEYDAIGRLVGITESAEQATGSKEYAAGRRRYKESSRLMAVTASAGQVTRFGYDAAGRRTSQTNADGKVTSYEYDALGRLTRTHLPDGSSTSMTYDAAGYPVVATDALGNTTVYEFDAVGRRTAVIDSLGNTNRYTYDVMGRLSSQTDANNQTTSFEYDLLGRLKRTTYPDGSSRSYTYDERGRRVADIDALGNSTGFAYDDVGRLTAQTNALGQVTSFGYDSVGRMIAKTNAYGQVTSYEYDAMGRRTRTVYPDGASETVTYDGKGRRSTVTDPAGNTTGFAYDDLNRVIARTNALGQVTSYAYDAMGRMTSQTDPKNQTTAFEYDALGRLTRTTYHDGTFQESHYDLMGRRVAEIDPVGAIKSYAYDAVGRLTAVTNAADQVTLFGYDPLGRLTAQVDANSRTNSFEYDSMGRRLRRTLPEGQTETYGYDAAGNMMTRTNFNGHVTTYSYDDLNRLIQKTPDPSLVAAGAVPVTFSFNAVGQRTNMTDASGVTAYAYDVRDRLICKATPQGTLCYAYDTNGNVARIQSSNTNGTILNYEYDALNRLSAVDDMRLGRTVWTYDPAGNLESSASPNQITNYYSYNALNRLTNLFSWNAQSNLVSSYGYTVGPAGHRLSAVETLVLNSQPAVLNRQYAYDPLYRLTNETITTTLAAPSSSATGMVGYAYDSVGNRLRRDSTVSTIPAATYAYTGNDRLVADQYDANGNTTNAWLRDPLTGLTNQVSDRFDFEDRLFERQTTISNQSAIVSIVYDGDGNRARKTVTTAASSVTTYYLVDELNPTGRAQVLEELTQDPNDPRLVAPAVTRIYCYGHGLVSQEQLIGNQWAGSFYGFDGHGNVRYLTDPAGNLTDTYDYDAFGNLLGRLGNTPNNYLFAGEQFDPDLGLYYLRARYADPDRGRFWSMDTFEGFNEDPASLHKYTFNQNDPVNRLDPSGHMSLFESCYVAALAPMVRGAAMSLFDGINNYAYGMAGGNALKFTSRTEAYFIDSLAVGPGWKFGKPNFWAAAKGAPFLLTWNANIWQSSKPCYYQCILFDMDVPVYGPSAKHPMFEFEDDPGYAFLEKVARVTISPTMFLGGGLTAMEAMGKGTWDLLKNTLGTYAYGEARDQFGSEIADRLFGSYRDAMTATVKGLFKLDVAMASLPVLPALQIAAPAFAKQQIVVLKAFGNAFTGGAEGADMPWEFRAGYTMANVGTTLMAVANLSSGFKAAQAASLAKKSLALAEMEEGELGALGALRTANVATDAAGGAKAVTGPIQVACRSKRPMPIIELAEGPDGRYVPLSELQSPKLLKAPPETKLLAPPGGAAEGGTRTFFSVQSEADAARLASGGAPWPTGLQRANLGEGLYAWGTRADAEAYAAGKANVQILQFEMSEANYSTLKTLDMRSLSDEAATAWLDTYSHYGQGLPHGLDHVIRGTGSGVEFYFSPNAFKLFE